jgi:hypothetical protein
VAAGAPRRPPRPPLNDDRPRRPVPRPGARYVGFVGLAFAALVAVATYSTIRSGAHDILGVNASVRGRPLPEFAVPRIPGGPDLDANIYQDDCASAANPCPAGQRRASACQIHVRGAIRVCDLFDRPLVISFWFLRAPTSCLQTQDAVNQIAARFRDRVNFLSIDVHDDRAAVAETVAKRGWKVPVGWDRDGAVSDLYRVGGCPTVAFVYPGGIFAGAKAGVANLTPPKLDADVRRLLAASRRRASNPV